MSAVLHVSVISLFVAVSNLNTSLQSSRLRLTSSSRMQRTAASAPKSWGRWWGCWDRIPPQKSYRRWSTRWMRMVCQHWACHITVDIRSMSSHYDIMMYVHRQRHSRFWWVLGYDGPLHEGGEQRKIRGGVGWTVPHVWQVRLLNTAHTSTFKNHQVNIRKNPPIDWHMMF